MRGTIGFHSIKLPVCLTLLKSIYNNKNLSDLWIIAVCSCFGTSATIAFFEPNLCGLFLTNYCTNYHDSYGVLMQFFASKCLYTSGKLYINL